MGPSGTLPGRELPDLRRDEPETPRVERLAEGHGGARVPVPGQLEDGRFHTGEGERCLQPPGRSAGVHDDVDVAGRRRRVDEAGTERSRRVRLCCIHVDDLHGRARVSDREVGDEQAHHASADDRHAISRTDARVPDAVQRRLQVRGEDGAARRNTGWEWNDARRGYDVRVLMRKETEHLATGERALPHASHARVAVLHRPGETPDLVRRSHAHVLGRRHPAAKDGELGATAHAAEQRVHHDVVVTRDAERLGPHLTAFAIDDPECFRVAHAAWTSITPARRSHDARGFASRSHDD